MNYEEDAKDDNMNLTAACLSGNPGRDGSAGGALEALSNDTLLQKMMSSLCDNNDDNVSVLTDYSRQQMTKQKPPKKTPSIRKVKRVSSSIASDNSSKQLCQLMALLAGRRHRGRLGCTSRR